MPPPPKTGIVKLSSWVKGKEGANLKSSVPASAKGPENYNARITVIDIRLQQVSGDVWPRYSLPTHCMALLDGGAV
jgi:hypothetical protein